MSNKKPYGHAGEWEPSIGGFTCDCCKEKKGEYYKEEVHLCQSCYDRYVTPAPAAASTESLIELKSQHPSNVKVKGPVPSAKDVYAPEKRPIDLLGRLIRASGIPSLKGESLREYRDRINSEVPIGEIKYYDEWALLQNANEIKRQIDPAEVDETWVGATVERIDTDNESFSTGKHYEVKGFDRPYFLAFDNTGRFTRTHCCFFTLVKKADESKVIECELVSLSINGQEYAVASETIEIDDPPPKTRTEVTHSALLEFPNGDRVKIPPPQDSEGWEAETLWDETEWPHRYYDKDIFPGNAFCCHVSGELVYVEYRSRASCENPRIVSLTKWTREVAIPEPTLYIHSVDRTCELVNSTWPQRHPPGAVKYGEE